MKTLKAGLILAVLAALTALFLLQRQTQDKLHAENTSLAQQLAQLQTDNETLSHRLATAGDAGALSEKEHNELLKLRGEVGLLRRQVGEIAKLREENHKLQNELANQIPDSLPSPEQAEFNMRKIYAINDMKQLGLAMRVYAGDHNDQYATNFYQLNDLLGGNTAVTNFMSKYEFVNTGLVNESMPDKIIFREQNPAQNPTGGWDRVYGFSDGSVQVEHSDNGNFDAFEQPRLVSPP